MKDNVLIGCFIILIGCLGVIAVIHQPESMTIIFSTTQKFLVCMLVLNVIAIIIRLFEKDENDGDK